MCTWIFKFYIEFGQICYASFKCYLKHLNYSTDIIIPVCGLIAVVPVILYDRPTPPRVGGEGLSRQSLEPLLHVTTSGMTDITEYMILYDIEGKSAIAFAQTENGKKMLVDTCFC